MVISVARQDERVQQGDDRYMYATDKSKKAGHNHEDRHLPKKNRGRS